MILFGGICRSRNWEVSIDFKVLDHETEDSSEFDIWMVIYIGLNVTGLQKNFYITVHVFVKTEFDKYEFYCKCIFFHK